MLVWGLPTLLFVFIASVWTCFGALGAPFSKRPAALVYRYRPETSPIPVGAAVVSMQRTSTFGIPNAFATTTQIALPSEDLRWVQSVINYYTDPKFHYFVRRSTGGYSFAYPSGIVFVTRPGMQPLRIDNPESQFHGRPQIEVAYSFLETVRDAQGPHSQTITEPVLRDTRGELMYYTLEKRLNVEKIEDSHHTDRPWVIRVSSINPVNGWLLKAFDFGVKSNSSAMTVQGQLLPLTEMSDRLESVKVLVDGRYQALPHVRASLGDSFTFRVAVDGIRFSNSVDEKLWAEDRLWTLRQPNNRGRSVTTRELIDSDRREPAPQWKFPVWMKQCWKWLGGSTPSSIPRRDPPPFT